VAAASRTSLGTVVRRPRCFGDWPAFPFRKASVTVIKATSAHGKSGVGPLDHSWQTPSLLPFSLGFYCLLGFRSHFFEGLLTQAIRFIAPLRKLPYLARPQAVLALDLGGLLRSRAILQKILPQVSSLGEGVAATRYDRFVAGRDGFDLGLLRCERPHELTPRWE